MSAEKKNKKELGILRYYRETRTELKKVRWPSREETWMLTKIVLVVTVGMAIFLGLLDLFFGWLLGGVIAMNPIFIILGVVVIFALLAAIVLIARSGEGV